MNNDYLDITVGWIGDNLKHQLSPFLEDITQDFLLIQLIVIYKPWSYAFFCCSSISWFPIIIAFAPQIIDH